MIYDINIFKMSVNGLGIEITNRHYNVFVKLRSLFILSLLSGDNHLRMI